MMTSPSPLHSHGVHLRVALLLWVPALVACQGPSLPVGTPEAPVHLEAVRVPDFYPLPEMSTGWSLDEVVFRGAVLDLSGETGNTRSVDFHPDGTLLFVVGRDTENVVAYALSSPWDVTTGLAVEQLDISPEMGSRGYPESVAHGFYIRKDDGTRMWVWNRTEIFEYTLDEPWGISTARNTAYRSFEGTVLRGHDIDFRPDGMRLFVDDRDSRAVFQFTLAEPWEVTTAELEYVLDISDQEEAVRGIEFGPTGTRMFLMDTDRREVLEYHLSTPWELETARFVQALSVGGQADNPRGITWRTDGTRLYVTQATGTPALFQYDLVVR